MADGRFKGIRVESSRFGTMAILMPVIYENIANNHNEFSSTASLVFEYPSIPYEATMFSNKAEEVSLDNKTVYEWFSDYGFPSLSSEDMNSYDGDTWTFSNGNSYTVCVYGSGNRRGLSLNTSDTTSNDFIPITYAQNGNFKGYTSVLGYDENYPDIAFGYGYAADLDFYGSHKFTMAMTSTSPSEANFPISVSLNQTAKAFYQNLPNDLSEDPYEGGGYSGEGGGSGTFTDVGDNIDFPSVPTLSAAAAGMIKIFQPTSAQLSSLGDYLWTSTFIDTVKKLFADPMDAIVSLAILPVTATLSGQSEIKVGGIGTGVYADAVSSQYVTVDCGSLTITKYYGSALDQAGYTKYMLYLPYIGTHQINADDIVGKTIYIKYIVDVLTGACTACVKCGGSVLYQYSGSCAVQIPLSGRDFGDVVRGVLSIAGAGAAIAASGGMSAPISGAMAAGAAMTLANNAINAKPQVQYSGSLGGASGLMGVQTPYLIVERPKQSLAEGYNGLEGYPSNISAKIGTLTGFTKIEKVHLENIPATTDELNELEAILKEGILI